MHVREGQPEDAAQLERLLGDVPGMPDRIRAAARESLREALAGRRCLVAGRPDEPPAAYLTFDPVPLARSATDIGWLVPSHDPGGKPKDAVETLVAALRDGRFGPSSIVRFSSGHWQRGGLDAHVLDAAGMARAGAVESFFGRGDDLVLFVARPPRSGLSAFDPTSAAALYDAAFAYRDFAFERDFLLACAARFGTRKVLRAASWGCWTGRHLLALADRGIDAVGIDEASEALALADATFREDCEGPNDATWVLARLDEPVGEPQVDLSFAMLSAVHRVGSAESMVRHLRSVAALLAPGGVHVIEATLPADATREGNTQTVWTERRGDLEITSRFRILVERRARSGAVPTVLDVRCKQSGDEGVLGSFHQEELWIVPDEAGWRDLVARAGGFAIAAILGDFQLDVRWDQAGAWRMILVLRRTEDSTAEP